MLLFQVCHFLGVEKSQMEQDTLILNKTILNTHMYYKLKPSREWLLRIPCLLHLVVEKFASSSSVISQLFDRTLYISFIRTLVSLICWKCCFKICLIKWVSQHKFHFDEIHLYTLATDDKEIWQILVRCNNTYMKIYELSQQNCMLQI